MGQQGNYQGQSKGAMNQTDPHPHPPCGAAPALEGRSINEGQKPTSQQMAEKAYNLAPVTVSGKNCAKHERQTHSGDAKPLARLHNDGNDYAGDKAPEEDAVQVNVKDYMEG